MCLWKLYEVFLFKNCLQNFLKKNCQFILASLCANIITTRIRRMGKVMFSVCTHRLGGVPNCIIFSNIPHNSVHRGSQVTGPRSFVGAPQSWPGVPESWLEGCPRMGYPTFQPGLGYPLPQSDQDGVPPPDRWTEHQREHLLRVHAGGLSCASGI